MQCICTVHVDPEAVLCDCQGITVAAVNIAAIRRNCVRGICIHCTIAAFNTVKKQASKHLPLSFFVYCHLAGHLLDNCQGLLAALQHCSLLRCCTAAQLPLTAKLQKSAEWMLIRKMIVGDICTASILPAVVYAIYTVSILSAAVLTW